MPTTTKSRTSSKSRTASTSKGRTSAASSATGALKSKRENAEHGFMASTELIDNLQQVLVDLIELLEQRSRPSLFSNALPATVACSARKAIEIIEREPERVARLHHNVRAIRSGLARLGYECPASPTAIIPIMIGDTAEAYAKSRRLMELGIMVIGFGYPVVPQGQARLRVQVSAALEPTHIERILDAFAKL